MDDAAKARQIALTCLRASSDNHDVTMTWGLLIWLLLSAASVAGTARADDDADDAVSDWGHPALRDGPHDVVYPKRVYIEAAGGLALSLTSADALLGLGNLPGRPSASHKPGGVVGARAGARLGLQEVGLAYSRVYLSADAKDGSGLPSPLKVDGHLLLLDTRRMLSLYPRKSAPYVGGGVGVGLWSETMLVGDNDQPSRVSGLWAMAGRADLGLYTVRRGVNFDLGVSLLVSGTKDHFQGGKVFNEPLLALLGQLGIVFGPGRDRGGKR